MLSVIVPASNEAGLIGRCIEALLSSAFTRPTPWQLIIVANGCLDSTADIARSYADAAEQANVDLLVLDLAEGNKLNAINVGETYAIGEIRVYIDADVIVEPGLLDQLARALAGLEPAYATGTLKIAPPRSWATRTYARFWSRLPFVTDGSAGCGVFAVNRSGRARWAKFPPIISDDTFVRLHFTPSERTTVRAGFTWPMVEGAGNLVRVRRRQDRGVQEIMRFYPQLLGNEGKSRARLLQLARIDPTGFAFYALVALLTKLPPLSAGYWVRGR
ncbi:glycosyltransferase [Devosia submarina]|uniref:glycosyltransferase n=1 Tax=Devosia submarina TaxID=1173082 RepID=UPI000D3D47A4|nr:glycosyltransferase [Devosia submarina]